MPILNSVRHHHPATALAMRPHWLHGPHVLIGIGGDPLLRSSLADQIGASLKGWLGSEDQAQPLSEVTYHRRSQMLAKMEQVDYQRTALRRDLTIDFGDFTQDPPYGSLRLADLRDDFRSASLWTAFDILMVRKRSLAKALVSYGRLFIALEHVRWANGFNPWPLSLQGQADASRKLMDSADFRQAVLQLEELLFEDIVQHQSLEPRVGSDTFEVRMLQEAYDAVSEFAGANAQEVGSWAHHAAAESRPPNGLSAERWLKVLANPDHFAYRFVVNHLYDMQPLLGLNAVRRWILCAAITNVLKREFPEIVTRAWEAGRRF